MATETAAPNLDFGELLHHFRTRAGLTQAELAELAGLSVRGISDLERGARTRPQRETLRRLLAALDVDHEHRHAFLNATRPAVHRATPPTSRHAPRSHGGAAGTFPPHLPGPLVGRDAEMATLRARLCDPMMRLITLTGPGGAGKTRLALSLAHDAEVCAAFPGGIAFVDLSALTDATLVAPRIAAALQIAPSPHEPVLVSTARRLGTGRPLLILDNCEQVWDAGADLATLLAAAPRLTILTTSRHAFAIRAEQVIPVPPLPLPTRPDLPLQELATIPAVALFVARAQAGDPGFHLTAENAEAIAAICRRLDGLPLAIELAAARVPFLSVAELAQRLHHGLSLLNSGPRDLPVRQRTLRDTIAWSYDLLDAGQQRCFRVLGVFAGDFSLEGLSAIRHRPLAAGETEEGGRKTEDGTSPSPDTLDLLAALVARNLVRRVDAGYGQTRYVLLETIREYAAARLAEDPETNQIHATHLAFLHRLAKDATLHVRGGDFDARLQHIGAEEANVVASLRWAVEHDPAAALAMADALGTYWAFLGRHAEGLDVLTRVLQAGSSADVAATTRVLCHAAWLAILLGDFDRAEDCARRAQRLVTQWPQSREEAVWRLVQGTIAHARGDATTAGALLHGALAKFEARSDTWGAFACLGAIGMLALEQGDATAAAGHYRQALAVLDAHQGSRQDRAAVLINLAVVYRHQGESRQAYTLAARALALTRQDEPTPNRAAALQILGRLDLDDGDIAAAAAAFGESLRLWQQIGDRWSIASALETVAALPATTGGQALAVRLLAAAAALRALMAAPATGCAAAERDDSIVTLRAALGEKAFRRAWAEGEILSVGDALSAAIASTNTPA